MGRKYLGKVTQNFRISPEFQAFCRREAEAAGKSLGDWLEDYVMQTKATEADSQGQILPKVASEKTMETSQSRQPPEPGHRESEEDTEEAICCVALALQAWMVTPQDVVARKAFEVALRQLVRPSP